jgi:hypothetical protein
MEIAPIAVLYTFAILFRGGAEDEAYFALSAPRQCWSTLLLTFLLYVLYCRRMA